MLKGLALASQWRLQLPAAEICKKMSIETRTSVEAQWFLDSSVTLSSSRVGDFARLICHKSNPFGVFGLGPLIEGLSSPSEVSNAGQTFEERIAELLPHLGADPQNATVKVLRFSQSVNASLRGRLVACMREEQESAGSALKSRVGHLTAIQQVNSVANSTLDLEQVMDLTIEAVSEVLRLDDCSIFLHDEALGRLTLRATTGLKLLADGGIHVDVGSGVTGWAAQHGEPVVLEDAKGDPRYIPYPDSENDPVQSMLSVPIILFTVNRLIGVLDLQTYQPRRFSKEEIGFVETVCGQIAIAIDNARLYEQTDEKLREKVGQLTTLQRVWASLASSLDLDQVLEVIARHAAELSHADKAAILKVDEDGQELFVIAGFGLSKDFKTLRVKMGDGPIGRPVAHRTAARVKDALEDSELTAAYPQMAAEGVRSMLCVPLVSREQVLGGISVFTTERHEFSEEQMQLVSTFAHDAALAIENARLYQEAQRALETQAILMREMQHRVKNNLQTVASLLSLQMRRAESPEAASLLRLSAARIESIAAVHELFSEEDIGLATVGEIANRIMDIVLSDLVQPGQEIDFAIDPATINLGSKQATVFALVLNELVSNAIMHGLAGYSTGSIRITVREENGTIAVEVWNSGRGVPDDFSVEDSAGLGLSIVEQLMTHELSGTFQMENTPSGGATARITFPAEQGDFWTVWWKG